LNYSRFDNFLKVVKSRTTADLTTFWKLSNLELQQIWQLFESCQISNYSRFDNFSKVVKSWTTADL